MPDEKSRGKSADSEQDLRLEVAALALQLGLAAITRRDAGFDDTDFRPKSRPAADSRDAAADITTKPSAREAKPQAVNAGPTAKGRPDQRPQDREAEAPKKRPVRVWRRSESEKVIISCSVQHPQPLTVKEAREQMRSSLKPLVHRIAGVSFEGRQDAVQELQPDEAVMLKKDPKNKFDPNAIQVRRLGGEDLGFVPKELTGRFPHDTTFGHIHHVGQVPKVGLWGALVIARPTLVPLTVDAIPDNVLPYTNLSNLLSRGDWDKLCRTIVRAANFRCQISGGSGPNAEDPVQCQEVWAFDDDRAEMRLVGLQAVCPEIFLAKRLLRQLDDNSRQTGLWTLQAMNDWTIMEAEAYLQYVDGIARDRSRKQWTTDLSWLIPWGIPVPKTGAKARSQ